MGGSVGKHARNFLLRDRLGPIAMDAAHDLEIGILGDGVIDAGVDLVVDEDTRDAANLEQVALEAALLEIVDLHGAELLEIDRDPIGARLGHDAVEGHHDDAGVAGLFYGTIEGRRRGRVDHDRVVALQDHVLDLRGLFRGLVFGRREGIRGRYDVIVDGLLGDGAPALQHRLSPGIAGVIVG